MINKQYTGNKRPKRQPRKRNADQGTQSNMLHNSELPISLAMLHKVGGPQEAQLGYLARKQRMEATIGRRIPENDGKVHAHTLAVSEYKRRRGLL